MRLAILISFAAFGWTSSAAWADGPATNAPGTNVLATEIPAAKVPFVRVVLGLHSGYIVPESYAEAHKADLLASLPGPVKIDGFWTPSESSVTVAERVFRERIESAAKDPALLFPGLAKKAGSGAGDPTESLDYQQKELELISVNFDSYLRQYVGIIMEKKKLIFCNYSVGVKVDPSTDYIFTDKVFVGDGTVHFLQCRFDPQEKTCSNVSMIGSWQRSPN